MSSILDDIKESLGLDETDDAFDKELMFPINSAIAMMNGMGLDMVIFVTDNKSTWDDLMGTHQVDPAYSGLVKEYMRLYVKIIFDPPAPSTLKVMIENRDELLWRLRMSYDGTNQENGGVGGGIPT